MPDAPAQKFAPAVLFAAVIGVIAGAWWWMGMAVPVTPGAVTANDKLYCVSYAPFRDGQSPLDGGVRIEPFQIEEDLARLSLLTDCVRTYAVELGLDQVPEIAKRHGMKVIQGLWLGSKPEKNAREIETVIALAKKYPDTIRAIVVGNEVLLRGEMAANDLIGILRNVKSQVAVPVTYADVWEFWLRFRDIANAVDFVTIHILPYWEDFPIPAQDAVSHVDSIRKRVAVAFPGKEVLIGETGWPSHGRMREGALPSPANQAQFLQDVVALSKREGFHVNLIEAFDQPWKRFLEGTVGGYWGLLDARTREFKFAWGQPVSNHPLWPWQAAGGVLVAALIFLSAGSIKRSRPDRPLTPWLGVAVNAAIAGVFVSLAVENARIESLGPGGWTRSIALVAVSVAAPVFVSAMVMRQTAAPSFAQVLAHTPQRIGEPLVLVCGLLFAATTLLGVHAALGLVFDPRYRDFPFAPLTAAIMPFVVLSLLAPRATGAHPLAEMLAAATLAISAVYIVLSESIANWQAVWIAILLAALAFTLFRVRAARS